MHGDWLAAHCCVWGYTEQPIQWFWQWLIQSVPLTWSKAQGPECITAAPKDSLTQESVHCLPRCESNISISASANYEALTRMIICKCIHFLQVLLFFLCFYGVHSFKNSCVLLHIKKKNKIEALKLLLFLNWKKLEVRTLTTCWIWACGWQIRKLNKWVHIQSLFSTVATQK